MLLILQFTIFLSVVQGIIGFGHWIVYRTLTSFLSLVDLRQIFWLKFFFVFLAFSFLFSSLMANRIVHPIVDKIYTGTAIWLGTLHLLVIASIAFWLLVFLSSQLGIRMDLKTSGQIFFGIALALSVWGVINSYNTKVVKYDVRISNLPQTWNGKTIALVSDVHLGNVRQGEFLNGLVEKINSHTPDAVFIAGDLFDGPPADYDKMVASLKKLNPPQGTYFSNGNHEEFGESSPFVNAISGTGVQILNNRFIEKDGLQIIGVTYKNSNSEKELSNLLDSISYDKQKPSLLIKHAPFVPEVAEKYGISLMLSGHTHLGQMWPLNLITKLVYKGFEYGRNDLGNMTAITTSGAGTWGPPQRLGTQSEVVIITLRWLQAR